MRFLRPHHCDNHFVKFTYSIIIKIYWWIIKFDINFIDFIVELFLLLIYLVNENKRTTSIGIMGVYCREGCGTLDEDLLVSLPRSAASRHRTEPITRIFLSVSLLPWAINRFSCQRVATTIEEVALLHTRFISLFLFYPFHAVAYYLFLLCARVSCTGDRIINENQISPLLTTLSSFGCVMRRIYVVSSPKDVWYIRDPNRSYKLCSIIIRSLRPLAYFSLTFDEKKKNQKKTILYFLKWKLMISRLNFN